MKQIINFCKKRRAAFRLERVVCRLLASMCAFWAWGLWKDNGFGKLSYRQDMSVSAILLWIGIFFLFYSAVNFLLYRYETDSWFLLAGATVCVVRWLRADSEFLFLLAVILAYSLFVLYFVRANETLWERWNPGKKTVWPAAALCGLICGGVIGTITCLRYLTFAAQNFDFGIFVNMFHHMAESGLPLCSCERDVLMSHFAVHLSPIFYVLLPFYALFPSPLTLQIGQAVALASGVIPVVLICRSRKLSGWAAIVMAALYSFYPVLSTGCFYDLHENCFLTPLLLWTFYFFERRKYIPMYVFAALTLTVKEDAAVYVLFFALYVIFAEKKYLHGAILAVGAVAYFSVAFEILERTAAYYAELYKEASPNPQIRGPMVNRYNNLIYAKADGLGGALKTLLVNPGYFLKQLFKTTKNDWGKLLYFLRMLLPLGFLPFLTRKPSRWILIAPILMNLMTNYLYQYELIYQYHFGIAAFLIYASILNLSDVQAPLRRSAISVALAACLCLYLTSVIPTLRSDIDRMKADRETFARMEEILETVPKDASVNCSSVLLPHLADRDEVYDVYYHGADSDTDYVILDARTPIETSYIMEFIRQGYEVAEEHENLLLILVKKEAQ